MIPVMHNDRTVGWLPPIAFQYGTPVARFALFPRWLAPLNPPVEAEPCRPPNKEVIELRIVNQRTNGVPGELHASSLAGLCRLNGFSPEDRALKDLRAADAAAA